jgi:Na+-transporting NADH:ubiquinone oxidoreductase subunit NqrC
MMVELIATVGIDGYFREQADQKKSLLAFADVARSRFAEEAKRIHRERDRDIRERDRDVEAKEFRAHKEQQAKGRQAEEAEVDRLLSNVESP